MKINNSAKSFEDGRRNRRWIPPDIGRGLELRQDATSRAFRQPTSCVAGKSLWFGAAALFALAALPVPQATAQQADQTATTSPAPASGAGSLEEITVTAQRRSQSIMVVPISISALSSNDLEKQDITQSGDLSASVPNLQVNSGFGEALPNFALRGIGVGNEYDANQESPVGVYVDDEYISFRTMQGMQLFDLDRIEVLAGPQGTLYGRNTTGGLVNFISKKPTLGDDQGYVEFGYGNFNDIRAKAAFEHTLVPDKLGVRAAVNYETSDGYVHNLAPGQPDANSVDSLAGRINIRATPTDDLEITLKLSASGGNPTQAAVWQRGTGPNLVNPITGYSRAGLDFWTVNEPNLGRNSTHNYGALLVAKYNVTDKFVITSLTSYDVANSNFIQEGSGAPFDILDTRYHNDYRQINQEIRGSYSGDTTNIQAGLYYGSDRNYTLDKYGFFFFTPSALSIVQQYLETRESKAVFVQVDQKFLDHWTVTGGARYTFDSAEYADGFAYEGDRNYQPLIYTVPGPEGGILPTRHNSDHAITGRFALTYTTDDGQIVYGSYNHGYRSGNYTGQGYFSPDQVYYVQPESVDAYEIGAKGRFLDGRLSISAAFFYDEYTNQQLNEVIGAVGFLRNAGASTIKGGELDVTSQVTPDVRAHLSVGLLDAKYDTLTLSGTVLDGNTLPFAPTATVNGSVDWRIGTIGGGSVTFSPLITFTSQMWFSPFNAKVGNQYLQQGDLAKVDLSLRWEHDDLSVRLWVNNLFNEESYTYGLNLQGSFGYDYLLQGPPQTFGASVRYDF